MKSFFKITLTVVAIIGLSVLLSSCTLILQKGRTSDLEKIDSLSKQLQDLDMTKDELLKLQKAYTALEKSLSEEIGRDQVTLGIGKKGLVITFVDSVLFGSGKAELRSGAAQALNKVAKVCRRVVSDREVGVEGHTDNQPIKHSNWKSNWELSASRAASVVRYLVKKGVTPERLSATGFGQYRPVDTNKTAVGRQKNRRVEIIILPEKMTKKRKVSGGKYKK